MMKRNGMCPVCYLKQLFTPKKKPISGFEFREKFSNETALTPPMGWSSWNTFKNQIDEDLILQTAQAMKEKGLVDAGYRYLNLDDCWHSSERDEDGNLQGDLTRFRSGIPALVSKINDLGLKVGIYSSNGTYTCEDLPAGEGNEWKDAYTFAKWGVEFFKYDFCHNVPLSQYAPLIDRIDVAPVGEKPVQTVECTQALLYGAAKLMPQKNTPSGSYISGLDRGRGKAVFQNVCVEEAGDYVLTVTIFKLGQYDKFLVARVNDTDDYFYKIPPQKHWNFTARFQQVVRLRKGLNTIELSNPVACRADSAMIQYYRMGKLLKRASERVARENGTAEKPICYSICEWGKNEPARWGQYAGNMWRTTGDICPWWAWIVSIYDKTVDLYDRAGIGNWNDPDMLEVGNGKLTDAQNRSHFALWCMMCAPLILGNDIRSIGSDVLAIVTNRNLIAINQDALGKPAKRIVKGSVDVLVKPMADGSAAICAFNRGSGKKSYRIDLEKVCAEAYAALPKAQKYRVIDQWTGEETTASDAIECQLEGYGSAVYLVRA